MAISRDIPRALKLFAKHSGPLRTQQAVALGIHPATIYELRDSGKLTQLSRGLYRLASAAEFEHPDLALIGIRAPKAAVCLISALSFHGITTQIPAVVHLAVKRGSYHQLKVDAVPVHVYRYDAQTFDAGLAQHDVGGVKVNVYGVARSVVDAFKFRHKIGLDVALEALHLARSREQLKNRELLHFARLLRVEVPMRPYLQSVT